MTIELELIPESGCWVWMGGTDSDGYGLKRVGSGMKLAHRDFYERHNGPIPEGHHVDHRCFVRCCVNPHHLEAVTPAENNRRKRMRYTNFVGDVCHAGHLFTPENTKVRSDGRRVCVTCRSAYEEQRKMDRAAKSPGNSQRVRQTSNSIQKCCMLILFRKGRYVTDDDPRRLPSASDPQHLDI